MKPILFNTEMVKAILDGKKTQTRRLVQPQPPTNAKIKFGNGMEVAVDEGATLFNERRLSYAPKYLPYRILTGQADYLWVRETWCTDDDMADVFEENLIHGFYYRADNTDMDWVNDKEIVKWHPSIHMPKEAARIFLKVTNVRVERLQDISFLDALNEGISPQITEYNGRLDYSEIAEAYSISCQKACIDAFHKLWDSTIKKSELVLYGWNGNPWVFVYEFERCEKPIEEVKE